MRKITLLLGALTVLAAVFIAAHRQRLFLRDPLGKVLLNEVEVEGATVFINYSNDVLVFRPETATPDIVQHWDRIPGQPGQFTCWSKLACLTQRDQAAKEVFQASPQAVMNDREVAYRNPAGDPIHVRIR